MTQQLRAVGRQAPPIRFAVAIDGTQHRLFSYFPVAKDGSFAVHSYYPGNTSATKRLNGSPQALVDDGQSLSVSRMKACAVPFVPFKTTFHPSGTLVTKDRRGERFGNERDSATMAFDEIREPLRLCYWYPAYYTGYPLVTSKPGQHHNVFELTERTARIPSIVELRVAPTGFNLEHALREAYPWFGGFMDHCTLQQHGLVLYTVFRRSANPAFPEAQVFIVEWQ